jgi:hypothetical protein
LVVTTLSAWSWSSSERTVTWCHYDSNLAWTRPKSSSSGYPPALFTRINSARDRVNVLWFRSYEKLKAWVNENFWSRNVAKLPWQPSSWQGQNKGGLTKHGRHGSHKRFQAYFSFKYSITIT